MFGVNQHLANTAVAIFKVDMRLDEFWRPYIGQAVSGEIDSMVLIGGVEKRAATGMFEETLVNTKHSTRLSPQRSKLYITFFFLFHVKQVSSHEKYVDLFSFQVNDDN
jgi:hypothetical protein